MRDENETCMESIVAGLGIPPAVLNDANYSSSRASDSAALAAFNATIHGVRYGWEFRIEMMLQDWLQPTYEEIRRAREEAERRRVEEERERIEVEAKKEAERKIVESN